MSGETSYGHLLDWNKLV